MASPFDYQFIEPLTSSAEVRGSAVFCRFTCPVTGRSVSASEEITAAPPPSIEDPSRGGIFTGLRRSLAAALQGVLGSSEHAEAKAEAIPDNGVDADEAAKQRSIVRAFRSVSSLFRWEGVAQRWVAVDAGKDTLTAFERRLNVHPLRGAPDLDVVLRMLVAIDSADGQIDEEEREFLEPFAAAAGMAASELFEKPAPTTDEIGAIAPSRCESALMICWATALCDYEVKASEIETVSRFAVALGVSAERSAELKRDAQIYLLEKVLEEAFRDFSMTIHEEDQVVQTGRKLGLSLDQIQGAIRAFRERRGLA
jgi:tellurite resistance protein